MRAVFIRFGLIVCVFSFSVLAGCSAAESKTTDTATKSPAMTTAETIAARSSGAPTIEIKPNSPADTVRAFYTALRMKKFRDAIFLTNLRPAIEGLTDTELKEYDLEFEAIAKYVPEQIQINGEMISGSTAVVTAKLPNDDLDKEEIQQIKLRKEGEVWVILTVDETAEKKIKQEGKNYFAELRIDTHQDEARDMLDRVAKAQLAFSTTNQGNYGDMDALIAAGFLPGDIRSSDSTGYVYSVSVSKDKQSYTAAAVPAIYGKTGRLSFAVELDEKGQAHLTSKDAGRPKTK